MNMILTNVGIVDDVDKNVLANSCAHNCFFSSYHNERTSRDIFIKSKKIDFQKIALSLLYASVAGWLSFSLHFFYILSGYD